MLLYLWYCRWSSCRITDICVVTGYDMWSLAGRNPLRSWPCLNSSYQGIIGIYNQSICSLWGSYVVFAAVSLLAVRLGLLRRSIYRAMLKRFVRRGDIQWNAGCIILCIHRRSNRDDWPKYPQWIGFARIPVACSIFCINSHIVQTLFWSCKSCVWCDCELAAHSNYITGQNCFYQQWSSRDAGSIIGNILRQAIVMTGGMESKWNWPCSNSVVWWIVGIDGNIVQSCVETVTVVFAEVVPGDTKLDWPPHSAI